MRIILFHAVALLLLYSRLVTAELTGLILKVGSNITVSPHDNSVKSEIYTVGSVRSCASTGIQWSGVVINWKMEGCSEVKNDPARCHLNANNKPMRNEFEFVPDSKITQPGIGFTFAINKGTLQVYQEVLPSFNETIEPLKVYVVRGSVEFPDVLKGTKVTVGLQVYDTYTLSDNDVMYYKKACGEADFVLY